MLSGANLIGSLCHTLSLLLCTFPLVIICDLLEDRCINDFNVNFFTSSCIIDFTINFFTSSLYKNISDTLVLGTKSGTQAIICDLLLNRRMATWSLFDNLLMSCTRVVISWRINSSEALLKLLFKNFNPSFCWSTASSRLGADFRSRSRPQLNLFFNHQFNLSVDFKSSKYLWSYLLYFCHWYSLLN